jgi:hypothetical protein
VFEQFTDRARHAVVLSQEEARILKHNYIGTEHILLGLLREEDGIAARVLESFDMTVERVRAQVVEILGPGEAIASGQVPFTPRAKKVLELTLREALALGHDQIDTQHILLGLERENEGVAAKIMAGLDIDSGEIRAAVLRMIAGLGVRGRVERTPDSLERVGLSDPLLDGAGPALRALVDEIEERFDRPPDAGDLLVLLASVPDGLAARTLDLLGIDAEKLASAAVDARRDGADSALLPSPALASEIERIREKRNVAIARADELRKRERELLEQALAGVEERQAELLDDVRALLGLGEERDA